MAARLNPKQDERSRSAIQTTQLVKRLQAFAFEQADDAGNVVELDQNRLRAIEILLRKTLPDLSNVEIGADVTVTHIMPRPLTDEEWRAQHGAED
jgi:hypothetical protein